MTEFDGIANMIATHSIQLAINLVRPFRRQRARLDGRAATIRRLVVEVERLESIVDKLPDWIKQLERLGTAIFHEGGGSFSRLGCNDLRKEIREAADAAKGKDNDVA